MKLLLLGGSGWLGGELARHALGAGDDVTCVTRSGAVPHGADSVIADRDITGALNALGSQEWDAVIDVSRQPGQVRDAVGALRHATDSYVFVSSTSTYASHASTDADEDDALLTPFEGDSFADMADYGAAKVACENAVRDAFTPTRSIIARPGLIGGPGDPTGRTDYWPWRFAHPALPGLVLAPRAPELPTAVLDVRDLSSWLLHAARASVRGVFNVLGESTLFPDHLAAARAASGSTAEVVWVDPDWASDRGIARWAGTRSFPLWLPDASWYAHGSRSTARAQTAGLILRPLEETLRDGLAWRERQSDAAHRGAGLSDSDERALLAEAGATPSQ